MHSFNSTRALLLGAVLGLGFAVLPSSCGTKPIVRCSASNCDGCCDDVGTCFKGTSQEACGSSGASCSVCTTGQACARIDQASEFGGRCTGGTTGGGQGGGTGGGAATGGGTGGGTTGGGTGGGGSTDGGTCNATTCGNGCCSATGVCITNTTPSRCGTGGAACTSCMMANTCVNGTCTPCSGCIDVNNGQCKGGMADNAACGKNGGFCQACDQGAGQSCQSGVCGGGTTCNSSTCQGCCDGNNCKLPNQYTNAQCGQGAPGAACTLCLNGATCDALDAGMCVGGGGGTGGGGGGFPGLDGGLTFDICALNGSPCPTGKCCQPLATALTGTSSCVSPGDDCDLGFSGACDATTLTCQ